MSHEYPFPPMSPQYVSSADTEGELLANTHYGNRQIALVLRVAEPSDGASTNLAVNPKLSVDASNWTNAGMAGIARMTLYGVNMDAPAGPGADTALNAVGDTDLDVAYLSAAVTSGLAYTFSLWVYLAGATGGAGVKLTQRDAAGVLKASSATLTTLNTWTRLSVTFTATATATWRFGIEQTGAGTTNTVVTGALIEQSASMGNYFDGDTPGCSWSGAHNGSTSTRPATGGTRFYRITEDLQQAASRINAEGGVLMRVAPGGEPIFYDLTECDIDFTNDNRLIFGRRTQANLTLTARPFWRGVFRTLSDHVETTLPVAVGTDTVPGGQVPGLGRLVIDEDQAVDQWWAVWGCRSRNYSATASAGLRWEAEALTLLSDSALAAGAAGASGAGSNVIRQTNLAPNYVAMLSTQATGGGAHMSHIGSYRVFARIYRPASNAGQVSVAWEWAEGDFRKRNQNADVIYPVDFNEAAFTIADLGQVNLTKAVAGTQRWEGRLLAKSTVAGDEIDCDYIFFVPVDEGAGQVTPTITVGTPTAWSALSTMDTEAGVITGDALTVGGAWTVVTLSDADDFSAAAGVATRVSVSDTGTIFSAFPGRAVTAGTTNYTNIVAQVDFGFNNYSGSATQGLLLRSNGASNGLLVTVGNIVSGNVIARTFVPGANDLLPASTSVPLVNPLPLTPLVMYTLKVMVLANGVWAIYFGRQGGGLNLVGSGSSPVLATGGALATGRVGIYDGNNVAGAITRTYDNFSAFAPAADAAAFASQSLAIYPDRVVRKDSGGTLWVPVSKYEGSYARLPFTGREDRTLETIVKMSRGDPASMTDGGIDDLSFQWQHAPRGITLPEPT